MVIFRLLSSEIWKPLQHYCHYKGTKYSQFKKESKLIKKIFFKAFKGIFIFNIYLIPITL